MKRSMISLLIAAFIFSWTSCGGVKKTNDEETAQIEKEAVIAGSIPKALLTEELKMETIQLLKDLPDSDIPYRIASSEVKIGITNLNYMLPVSKASELTSAVQKACAAGIYFADYNVLKALGQPTAGVENVLAKLTSDLNITYILSLLQKQAPAPTSPEEFGKYLNEQEDQIIQELAADNKIDIQIELFVGIAAELAVVYANPSLVVQGDATSAGLTDNQLKRLEILSQIIVDLTVYYPELEELGNIISPLKEKVTSIQTARDANAEIIDIRDTLLK
jgi:hypothetical protein